MVVKLTNRSSILNMRRSPNGRMLAVNCADRVIRMYVAPLCFLATRSTWPWP